jgi:RNA polymerase sigma factor (sigma-70 family)
LYTQYVASFVTVGDHETPTQTRGAAREGWLDPATQFPLLYEQEHTSVYRTVRAIVLDAEDAEDLTQECFARAYRARAKYQPTAPPSAWLHRIAVNTAISHLRRKKLARFLPIKIELGTEDRGLARAEARSAVEEALAELSPKLRAAVILQYFHDCSRDEIAQILGIPSGTVASRIAKAMVQMRQKVAKHDSPGEPARSNV